jgi:RNA-directed DNA polymerase
MPEGLPPNRVNFNSSCQQEADGKRLLAALRDRLMQFGLSVHEGKTRLIEFGRFAAERRAAAGQRRPETFNFLGFTHYCSKTRNELEFARPLRARRLG